MPSVWTVKRLRFVAEINPSKSEVSSLPEVTEVSFLPMEAIGEDGSLDLERVRPLADVQTGYTYFRDGDVAIAKITPCFENGKGAVMRDLHGGIGFGTTELIVARPKKGHTTSEYLHWLFTSRSFRIAGEASMYGAGGQKRVPDDFVRDFAIAFPPLSEQISIATFLDHETANIDALIKEQKRLIELLKEKRQAVISQAVTKGIDPNVPMKGSGVEWLGEVPAHWEIGGLTRFIEPVVDYRGRTPTKVESGVFLVTARNIRDGKIDYAASIEFVDAASAESLLDRGRPEIGDLLFTMEAPLGQVALIDRTDIALAQRIVKFRGRLGVLQSNFLLYWFMGDFCQARLTTLATGSTALGIKASKLGMIECLVPPLEEQADIVRYLEAEFEVLDALMLEAEVASELLVERRSALISAAVTGMIYVRGFVNPSEPVAA
jgi:type I restriction enzyme S subunit